jgi:glycosyltransferase involved in cell wall biosynthesis
LSDRVSFVGFVESAEVYGYLKAAKVLVLASSREGFGMVVLEANACGLPVVTIRTPHNAAADLISDGINGFVAQPDADSLAEMILRALSEGPAMTPAAGVARYEWAAATDLAKQVYFTFSSCPSASLAWDTK